MRRLFRTREIDCFTGVVAARGHHSMARLAIEMDRRRPVTSLVAACRQFHTLDLRVYDSVRVPPVGLHRRRPYPSFSFYC